MNRFAWSLFGLAFFAATPSLAAEFVKNGSFEVNGGTGQIAPTTPAVTTLADWTKTIEKDPGSQGFAFVIDANADSTGFTSIFSPPNIKVWGPGNGVSNGFTGSGIGNYFLGIDGDYGRSSVSQQIDGLTVGEKYTLTFKYAGGQFTDQTGATDQNWDVVFGSEAVSTPVMNVPSKGFVGWNDFSHEFTAQNVSQLLKFTAIGVAPGSLPPFLMLDGVSLQGTNPVPGPLPALGVGACLAWSRKLRLRIRKSELS